MHSWVIIKDDYYDNLYHKLKSKIPEFSIEWDPENVYMILFDFGIYLIQNINSPDARKKCLSFINEAIAEGKNKTEDALVLQVFDQIFELPGTIELVRKELSPLALVVFNKAMEDYKR